MRHTGNRIPWVENKGETLRPHRGPLLPPNGLSSSLCASQRRGKSAPSAGTLPASVDSAHPGRSLARGPVCLFLPSSCIRQDDTPADDANGGSSRLSVEGFVRWELLSCTFFIAKG